AAVDEDVARLQQRRHLLDDLIDGRAGLDHDHHLARPFQRRDQLLDAVAADDVLAARPPGQEVIDARRGAVEDRHGVTATLDVEDEVFAHHGQADQANVGSRGGHGSRLLWDLGSLDARRYPKAHYGWPNHSSRYRTVRAALR